VRTIGVDLAAQPANTALAVLDWGPTGATVTELVVGCTDEDILLATAQATKVGIDCPFGWPLPFHRMLTEHHAGHVVLPDGIAPAAWRRDLAMRTTDLLTWREHGNRPLSVAADLIAYPAMRCAALLGRLAAAGHDVRRDGSGQVVETYPAASLKQWVFPHRGYKGVRGTPTRHDLVTELTRRADWLDLAAHRELCLAADHAFDAVVASLTARACALGLTAWPGPDQAHAAAVEGWIHVPTVALAQLSPVTNSTAPTLPKT
jgi:predicted nuclease with RNAse H fold